VSGSAKYLLRAFPAKTAGLELVPSSKYAAWFDICNKKFYEELVPVWDTWEGYGGWDYYSMLVSDSYKRMGGDFQQYLLEGQTIIEWTTGPLKNNLTDSFINYLKKENIHDYHCEKCNQKVLADKKVYIYNLPNFLILVLKRYNINGKLNDSISYPLENMKIRETESGEIFSYILYAIIYHYGHSQNGHYNCNVKINNNWYFIDDDSIYLNNNIENNNCNSYILFYKKC
jgi:uncharacterized UBP type Zn finger protein